MSDGSSDAPLYFSMVCFAVSGAGFWLKWHVAQRQQLKAKELIDAATQVQADFSARARAFEEENLQDWPHRLKASTVATRNYLLMAQGRAELRYLELVNTDRMVLIDQTIPLATIVSVELQQNSETVMRVESSSEIRRKGSAGRAALGALVAGPTGAVIGAASRSTSAAAKTVSTSYTEKGPTVLVIGTSDFDRPVIKVEVPSFEIGEEWLHRIKAAMLAARKAADDQAAEG